MKFYFNQINEESDLVSSYFFIFFPYLPPVRQFFIVCLPLKVVIIRNKTPE